MTRRSDYIRETMDDITRQFADHVITASGERGHLGWWTLHKLYPDGKRTSDMWCEIIEGHGGYLYVNGDISAAVFGIYGECRRPGQMVAWMTRPTIADGYMAEKLRIAMGHSYGCDPARSWKPDVAVEDLREYGSRLRAEDGDDANLDGTWLGDIIADINRGDLDQHGMCRALYELNIDPEEFSSWGEVPSSRLACAWGALRRLHVLLGGAL